MKRFHVHVAVHDLEKSIRFYKAMFDAEPTVKKDDYAKWQLDDPRINFAISKRGAKTGVDHLGIQAEDGAELGQLRSQLAQADVAIMDQQNATCCYAKSDKHWTIDPQGIAWESFHTLEGAPRYGEDTRIEVRDAKAACCAPASA
ncbi:MAG: ArsI/CadI family heavy metal resistance metalloenzyme [Burkholderiales bacterium]